MKIKAYKDAVLFEKARLISPDEFGPELDQHMSDMAVLMFAGRGVGLAGNQVGDARRILVADLGYVLGDNYGANLIKIVNPEILEVSDKTVVADEGCLSYPGLEVLVERPYEIKVRFFSPFGEEVIRDFSDWQARIIQHEMDHLNGQTLYQAASSFARKRYDQQMKKAGWK